MPDTTAKMKINSNLRSSLEMLQRSLPNGIRENEYYGLLCLLYDDFSDRNLADLISAFCDKDSTIVLNDIYKSQSTNKATPEVIERLREQMTLFGYDNWKKEE